MNYDNSSIDMSLGAERVRERPASVLGSSTVKGARHTFTELYGNALDEHTAGFGGRLDIKYYADGSISVRDYGRGVPIGWNDKEKIQNWNWHVIYNELYGGGKGIEKDKENQRRLGAISDWSKFDERDFIYLFSVGLNGMGAAASQYTSEFFEVRSYRDGVCTYRKFEKGYPLVDGKPVNMFLLSKEEIKAIPELTEATDEPNGTFIHWKPDAQVFDDVNIGSDWLLETCRDIADIAGITLYFEDENTGKSCTFEAGDVVSLVKKKAGNKLPADASVFYNETVEHGRCKHNNEDSIWVCKCNVAIAMTSGEVEPTCYHNSVRMLSGIQYDAISDAIYSFVSQKTTGRGIRIDRRDYEGKFGVVVSSYSNFASFRNQTKDGVDDNFIYQTIRDAILNKLNIEHAKGNEELNNLIAKVIEEAELRVAMKAVEKLKREANSIKREKEPEKFVSCDAYEQKNYAVTELWITEGDSAKGAVKTARNKTFQAIYPIRGKGINVAKKSIDRVLQNKEIREIFTLLGTGYDLNLKGENTFDISKLKFDKIIFATDADEDGYQIRVLLFLTFYHLAPQLITEGHVYIAETPRFRLQFRDGTCAYARNVTERDKLAEENAYRLVKIDRFKGLGEVNADVLRETTVHPDTRNLVQVTCDLENESERALIDALFGADKYNQRKSIITTVLGAEVADMMEENALMFDALDSDDIDDGVTYIDV